MAYVRTDRSMLTKHAVDNASVLDVLETMAMLLNRLEAEAHSQKTKAHQKLKKEVVNLDLALLDAEVVAKVYLGEQ